MSPADPEPSDDLEELLERAREGDRGAATEIAERYAERVRAVLRRRISPRLRARLDTDDLVQSTIVAALGGVPHYDYKGERAFEAWLTGIAENRLAGAFRFHHAARRDIGREHIAPDVAAPGAVLTPSSAAARAEERASVREAVERLPEPDRTVVRLRKFDELPFPEIARRLGMADRDAARYVFRRALKRLAEELDG